MKIKHKNYAQSWKKREEREMKSGLITWSNYEKNNVYFEHNKYWK